jgi:8-oxo-dGTP pyrophosphatase MutT (NUDIX family)
MRASKLRKRENIQLAATLVLVRDGAAGVEVYMTRRPGGIDFADLHVFPGGKVSAEDDDSLVNATVALRGLAAADADAQLDEAQALRYWLAAVRESFEECGVLFARNADGDWLSMAAEERADYVALRQALIDGQTSLAQLCAQRNLTIDLSSVGYLSHWLTPDSVARRFDTRFFLARMLPEQQTVEHADEVVSGHWVSPAAALAHADAGDWQLISPTRVTLASIAPYDTTEALWRAVSRREHMPLLTQALRDEGMCG